MRRPRRRRRKPPDPAPPGLVVWTLGEGIEAGKTYWRDLGVTRWPTISEWPEGEANGPAAGWATSVNTGGGPCGIWLADFILARHDVIIAAHEVGHCLGLDHLPGQGGVMDYRLGPEADRQLVAEINAPRRANAVQEHRSRPVSAGILASTSTRRKQWESRD